MTFKLIPYLQRIAACRGEPLHYPIVLDGSLVMCANLEQAKLIKALWSAWHKTGVVAGDSA